MEGSLESSPRLEVETPEDEGVAPSVAIEQAIKAVFPLAVQASDTRWRMGHPNHPSEAVQRINAALPPDKIATIISEGGGISAVVLHDKPTINRAILKPLLFGLATLVSTIVLMARGGPQGLWSWEWLYALPGALGIIAILFAHEWGHHLAARRMGMQVSYPYLIPLPIWWAGTLGGFVTMELPPTRRAALYVAAGGPLLGFLVAIPLALVGIWLSTRGMLEYRTVIFEDSGILWNALVAWLGPQGEGYLQLHPLAVAGYFGFMLTGWNLLFLFPLDGGRWMAALIPSSIRPAAMILLLVGFVVLSLALQQSLNGFILGLSFGTLRHIRGGIAVDDITPLPWKLTVIGFLLWLALLILLWDINPLDRVPFQFPN